MDYFGLVIEETPKALPSSGVVLLLQYKGKTLGLRVLVVRFSGTL